MAFKSLERCWAENTVLLLSPSHEILAHISSISFSVSAIILYLMRGCAEASPSSMGPVQRNWWEEQCARDSHEGEQKLWPQLARQAYEEVGSRKEEQ